MVPNTRRGQLKLLKGSLTGWKPNRSTAIVFVAGRRCGLIPQFGSSELNFSEFSNECNLFGNYGARGDMAGNAANIDAPAYAANFDGDCSAAAPKLEKPARIGAIGRSNCDNVVGLITRAIERHRVVVVAVIIPGCSANPPPPRP
jgi:hypothetical protein